MLDQQRAAVGLAVQKGVKIVYGTNIGGLPWGDGQAREFAALVQCRMTPMRSVRSATVVAAELLRVEGELGAVEPGKYAELVAVAGDPLQDITELEQVRFVMKAGRSSSIGSASSRPLHNARQAGEI